MKTVGLIDYGMGNLRSVRNAFEFLGAQVRLVRDGAGLNEATHVVLPGVGSFAEGMKQLRARGLEAPLRGLKGRKPFLGICLGMQLMAEQGVEGGKTEGLGLVAGSVPRLADKGLRIPHIGWNDIRISAPNSLLRADMGTDYYFVHSYHLQAADSKDVLAVCDYGGEFACAVGREADRLYGVQFHPEKSHGPGLRILKNFLEAAC